ncbi:MAG: tRNA lysidine(34) synthetase TilS [Candidatus Omnitrophota bacterium]
MAKGMRYARRYKGGMHLFSKVRDTIRNYGMLKPRDRVLAAVSGGPDSIFLLHALHYLSAEMNIVIRIAHLEHGIRGGDSLRDMLFTKSTAGLHNLPVSVKRVKVRKRRGRSLEETAREIRYGYFRSLAGRLEFSKIATAHTMDDQAETVLMRVIKGTSLKGLAGIPPVREEKGVSYIRPLIEIEKDDIIGFLRENSIKYVCDATNSDVRYFRNAVRHRILPYLERYNPRVKRALYNLSQNLREDSDFLNSAAEDIGRGLCGERGLRSIKLEDLLSQPGAVRREIVRQALVKCGLNEKKLTYRHWQQINALLRGAAAGKALDVPGGVRITKQKNALCFARSLP